MNGWVRVSVVLLASLSFTDTPRYGRVQTKDPATAGFGYPYLLSKAAIAHMTSLLAHDFLPLGVRVNQIAPGWVVTGMSAPGTVDEWGVSSKQGAARGTPSRWPAPMLTHGPVRHLQGCHPRTLGPDPRRLERLGKGLWLDGSQPRRQPLHQRRMHPRRRWDASRASKQVLADGESNRCVVAKSVAKTKRPVRAEEEERATE